MSGVKQITGLLLLLLLLVPANGSLNKYSKEANTYSDDESNNKLQVPFRMEKLNIIWQKAQSILTGQKLKNLKSDLVHLDKEEMSLKKIKNEGGDKEGLKGVSLRKQLRALLDKYGLDRDHVAGHILPAEEDLNRERSETYVFKDKKLDKLWKKAEKSLFTDEQLLVLREEFQHHQDKIDQYLSTMHHVDHAQDLRDAETRDRQSNSLDQLPDEVFPNSAPSSAKLKDSHNELKKGFEQLAKKVSERPDETLEDERVVRLWKLAQAGNMSPDELTSLREELSHFERRIKKLHILEADIPPEELSEKSQQRVSDLKYKIDKLHSHLEEKISRRIEL